MAQQTARPPVVHDTPIPMTWDEFVAWEPEGHAEWVAGEGIVYMSNTPRHMRIVMFLVGLLDRFVQIRDLGEVYSQGLLMRLPQRPSGRMPDVMVLDRGAIARMNDRWLDGPALLAIEVMSDDSVFRDLVEKRQEYERAGIAEYLVIDARPNHTGLAYLRLAADGHYEEIEADDVDRLHSAALPGFWLDPSWLDQMPMPKADPLIYRMVPEIYDRVQDEFRSK